MENILGLDELNRLVVQKGLCAACGACCGTCPYVTAFKGKTVVLDRCTVGEGRCFAYCPMTFFDPEPVSQALFGMPYDSGPIGFSKEVIASRASDAKVAAAGQGGGTVTALTLMALEENLIDCAVLTSLPSGAKHPQGIVATTADEIIACTGSKYVGAHSLTAVRQALDRGFQRIGVVGLPCQVRSLRKMGVYDLKRESLKDRIRLVIGLFCNWAFSGREFTAFLAEHLNSNEICRIHIPPPPADRLEVQTNRGLETVPLDAVRPLIQAACHVCPDMTSEFADLSVGMYEGRDGWNTLITRTDTGRSLLQMAMDRGTIQIDTFPEENLDHLKRASAKKKERSANQSGQLGESSTCH